MTDNISLFVNVFWEIITHLSFHMWEQLILSWHTIAAFLHQDLTVPVFTRSEKYSWYHCWCWLPVNMLLLVFFFNVFTFWKHKPTLCACGWTCICAYMCSEWEQGHSWGLGFLSEHYLQASLQLIGKSSISACSVATPSFLISSYWAPCSLYICILASVALVPIFLHFHLVKHMPCRFFYTSDPMSARYGHLWCLTGTLRKIMALPVGIWGSGFVVIFWLISVSHHVRLSSVSEEMMPNESRQIKSELCVVIKAVTPAGSLPLEYYEHCKGKKKNEVPLRSVLPPGAAT